MKNMQDQGLLVVLDGIDGCGKSTLIKNMDTMLTACGVDVVTVREPGGSGNAEAIRDILKSRTVTPLTAFHLMRAASIDLHENIVVPALLAGKTVLCDRWTVSSAAAYQGQTLGVNFVLDSIFSDPADLPAPDLAVWLDVSLEESQRRREERGEDEDNFGVLSACRDTFARLTGLGLMDRVDANRPIQFVETELAGMLLNLTDGRADGNCERTRRILHKSRI